jgi:hypothetical protein
MPLLLEVQASFKGALLDGDPAAALAVIQPDALAPEARLQIYRNHVFITLTDALKAIFPVVCRLVDERFFGYACHAYIREQPPAAPCLFEYGASFPDFLGTFAPCGHLPWLPDVARFEWAINTALHAEDAQVLDPQHLAGIAPERLGQLRLDLHPALRLLASPWAVDRIWQAHQGRAEPETLSLEAEPVWLEVRRLGDDVVFRRLDPPTFAFRQALAEGRALVAAAEAALERAPDFDLTGALGALLSEAVLTGYALLPPPTSETDQ